MRHFKILCLLSVLCFFCLPVFAQDDPNFETGLKPFGSYHGGNIDTINLLNGDTTLDIPLISYPQRGGKLKLDFVLHYASLGTYADQTCVYGGSCFPVGPVEFMHGFEVINKGAATEDLSLGGTYGILGSDGSIHTLVSQTGTGGGSSFQTVDGSGFHLAIGGTSSNPVYVIADADGIRYTTTSGTAGNYNWPSPVPPPSLSEDTNGNQTSYSMPGSNTFGGYVDTVPIENSIRAHFSTSKFVLMSRNNGNSCERDLRQSATDTNAQWNA